MSTLSQRKVLAADARVRSLACLGALALFCWSPAAAGEPTRDVPLHQQAALRRPIALAPASDGRLLVANRKSGSISVLHADSRQVQAEYRVAAQLADLAPAGTDRWLALDDAAHEALLLQWDAEDRLRVAGRVRTPAYPATLEPLPDGRFAVASLWSQRWAILRCEGDSLQVEQVLDLPFAARAQLALPDGRHVLVADAFGNQIATLALSSESGEPAARIVCLHAFPSHQIRGLKLSPDGSRVLVAHQMLNDLARTVRNDVHWGLLMSNDVRWLRQEALLQPDGDLYQGAHVTPLGEPGNGSADPTDLAVINKDLMLVTLGGVNELGVGRSERFNIRRVGVGDRPVAVYAGDDARRAWVANMLDDTLSEVDLEQVEVVATIPLGPQRPLTLAEQGEKVFYNAFLSHDGWMSCNSCHIDGHANAMLNDNFSDESFGAPKRVLSLLGGADTAPFAWNGGAPDLATQIRKSIVHTMQSNREPQDKHVEQLEAFLRDLQPPPSLDAARGTADAEAIARGRGLFEQRQCVQCHAPPSYTTPDTYDVGLKDEKDQTRFNPPSLRGAGQRRPYFHDGRAGQLRDVFVEFQHQLETPLSAEELEDLLAFLRSL